MAYPCLPPSRGGDHQTRSTSGVSQSNGNRSHLLVSEYSWLLRELYQGADSLNEVASGLMPMYSEKAVRSALRTLRNAEWIDQMILEQDRAAFMAATHIDQIRPNAAIILSEPGKYDNLLRHINAHHYYLGLQRKADVPFDEAVALLR